MKIRVATTKKNTTANTTTCGHTDRTSKDAKILGLENPRRTSLSPPKTKVVKFYGGKICLTKKTQVKKNTHKCFGMMGNVWDGILMYFGRMD